MKISKIRISNLFGISEKQLDGKNVEITGKNGTGKTSVIDAIRYALTNQSERDYIVRKGETEGEILIETDTGLSINRKKRTTQADYKNIKDGGMAVTQPETFLQKIFTTMQLDPVAFTQMTKQEQNRVILDLIEFPWDLNWIKDKFGEIPSGVNYEQNILQVLNDIQADKGVYFQTRQDVNRDHRNKLAFIEDIAKDIPEGYQKDKWESFDLGEQYQKLNKIQNDNNLIQRAKSFMESYDGKIRGFEAEKEISITSAEQAIASEREGLVKSIERMKAEIIAAEDKIKSFAGKIEDKKQIAESTYHANVAKLSTDMETAKQYSDKIPVDTAELQAEIIQAETMKKHLNEYSRMVQMQSEAEELLSKSQALTEKIELARNLPGEILKTAKIPVPGLTVEGGIPLINDLPISNLSEGEQLDLCVDVAIHKPNTLQIILIDGAEKLSTDNRSRLYAKCKAKGLQFIATRTTDDNELEVTEL